VLSAADLERALAAIGAAAPVRFDEVTGSTNATALALAEAGAPEWTLVGAGHQTRGRGRLGRRWEDRPGGALLVSVVLRPRSAPEAAGLLPLLAGVAMAEAATALVPGEGPPVRCEWPNDLVRDGGKVGGVLVESVVSDGAFRHAVVGVGVNLATPAAEPRARGLGPVDPAELLTGFLRRFAQRYRSAPEAFGPAVLSAWRAVSVTLGRSVEVLRVSGPAVRGTAVDIDARGALVVRTDRGDVAITTGEVRRAGDDPGPAVAGRGASR
jgi:BirA family transcriptional regulator, biotin operon repressor / biotin---[acetyl-CoA-carboxylase] ligase